MMFDRFIMNQNFALSLKRTVPVTINLLLGIHCAQIFWGLWVNCCIYLEHPGQRVMKPGPPAVVFHIQVWKECFCGSSKGAAIRRPRHKEDTNWLHVCCSGAIHVTCCRLKAMIGSLFNAHISRSTQSLGQSRQTTLFCDTAELLISICGHFCFCWAPKTKHFV